MKKYFVEVTVGIYLDEMDDDNSEESIAELADWLVNKAITDDWNADIVTTPTIVIELPELSTSHGVLDAYVNGGLY